MVRGTQKWAKVAGPITLASLSAIGCTTTGDVGSAKYGAFPEYRAYFHALSYTTRKSYEEDGRPSNQKIHKLLAGGNVPAIQFTADGCTLESDGYMRGCKTFVSSPEDAASDVVLQRMISQYHFDTSQGDLSSLVGHSDFKIFVAYRNPDQTGFEKCLIALFCGVPTPPPPAPPPRPRG
ncbi:hypothetical protein I5E68_07530 [Novosphingobium sp. YJ-S2-02]|uniref:Uncharacterized protein n=1 Tax=Novosphingobium aureum TaxID=2792964 RepID=A0A931HB81_9SPHN|nr:hypothetical protein [Novosphingobium aureum]